MRTCTYVCDVPMWSHQLVFEVYINYNCYNDYIRAVNVYIIIPSFVTAISKLITPG